MANIDYTIDFLKSAIKHNPDNDWAKELLKRKKKYLKDLKEGKVEKDEEEPIKVTKTMIKKEIKKLFDDDKIKESMRDKLLDAVKEKDYDRVLSFLKKKGVVFD